MIDTAIVYGAWACALFVGGVAIYATLEWLMGMTWRRMVRAAFVLTAGLIGPLALALMVGCDAQAADAPDQGDMLSEVSDLSMGNARLLILLRDRLVEQDRRVAALEETVQILSEAAVNIIRNHAMAEERLTGTLELLAEVKKDVEDLQSSRAKAHLGASK